MNTVSTFATLFYLAMGGAAGAILRFALVSVVNTTIGKSFPWATFSVNVIGSFVAGCLVVVIIEKQSLSELWRLTLIVGLLGSFTTFSAFAVDSVQLMQEREWWRLLGYIGSSVLCCIFGCWAGMALARL